ncbi:hypothetical protein LY76DRAFT_590723 [Colletotrichum caudatum]|nr:hypothetical protein LY76DRAFT_590723 [Colletotrichum caudatum]
MACAKREGLGTCGSRTLDKPATRRPLPDSESMSWLCQPLPSVALLQFKRGLAMIFMSIATFVAGKAILILPAMFDTLLVREA